MAAGDLTVTLVGTYATIELAIAAMDAGNDAAATDSHQLFFVPAGNTGGSWKLIKYVRAAA